MTEPIIPKILFQTDKMSPDNYVIDKLLSKCEGWEYLFFTDLDILNFFDEYRLEEFPLIKNKFNEMPTGAHKADLFRYYFLYVKGGVFVDSDAMIETNLDTIVKDYTFFSVKSTYVSGAIFQGFIGATSHNSIIYEALLDAYTVNVEKLKYAYHMLCRNLNDILLRHSTENIKLYTERYLSDDSVQILNDAGEIILIHYWKFKIIPK